jgi:AcrR family transcriptional regulator
MMNESANLVKTSDLNSSADHIIVYTGRMESSAASESNAPSRRDRLRAGMVEEIKDLARRQLAEGGPGAISLRAIARELGTASSALFRYYPSYNDLISALVVDSYNSVADAVIAARDAQPPTDYAGRWMALCRAYRRWSLDNPGEFALLHGTPVPGYEAPEEITGPSASRSIEAALSLYVAAVQAEAADPGYSQIPTDLEEGALWRSLTADQTSAYQPPFAGIVLSAWAAVLGYLVVEIFGSMSSLIDDTDRLYSAHVRNGMLTMGFDLELIEATDL